MTVIIIILLLMTISHNNIIVIIVYDLIRMHSFSAQVSGQRPLDSGNISSIKIAVLLTYTGTVIISESDSIIVIIITSTKKLQILNKVGIAGSKSTQTRVVG